LSVSEFAAFVASIGQVVWQQQQGAREEGPAVCFVSIAPFLLGAAAIGLRSLRRTLRNRPT
jgi:hypothetical protein